MSSAFDYQEIMAAAFQFGTTDTVEQVQARHDERDAARDAERDRKRPSSNMNKLQSRMPRQASAPPLRRGPTKSQLDQVREMFLKGGGPLPAGLAPKG